MHEFSLDKDAAERIASGLFFVIGTGRCGTTLLQSMLTSHPRLIIPPETHFFAKFDPAVALSEPLQANEVDRYLQICRKEAYWRDLEVDETQFADAIKDGVNRARSMFLWLLLHLAGPEGAGKRFGEKTPRHEKHIDRILELFPGAKFIHIYRDPRDVALSLREMPWRSSDSLLMMARRCRKTYDRTWRDEQRLGPKKYTSLRYESLVENPEQELRRICAFLGEEFDPAMLEYHTRSNPGFLESEKSWKAMTMKPIDRSRSARFRAELSIRDIRMIERVIGPHFERLGYDREPGESDRMSWRIADIAELGRARAEQLVRSVKKRLPGKRMNAANE